MINSATNNKRIAKNTLMLYIRMLFIMVVSLYTSRVVLQALGVEDFGVFNVVGGHRHNVYFHKFSYGIIHPKIPQF
mgnify:CR=1 FL=1